MGHETPASGFDAAVFFSDPVVWTAIGLIIFLGAVFIFMKPHKSIAKSLDDRAAKISSELESAAALRKEAEAKLADAERHQAEAEASAKDIVEAARREAAEFAATASASLVERIKLREKLAEERISRAESEAMRDVRNAAVDTASRAAAQILTEALVGKAAEDNFAQSLEAVKKALA